LAPLRSHGALRANDMLRPEGTTEGRAIFSRGWDLPTTACAGANTIQDQLPPTLPPTPVNSARPSEWTIGKISHALRPDAWTLLVVIVCLFAIAAASCLAGPHQNGDATTAIGVLKKITAAQTAYARACGGGAYANSLSALRRPTRQVPRGFLDQDVGLSPAEVRSGYIFDLTPGMGSIPGPADCNGQATVSSYYASATPVDSMGHRSFAISNEDRVVWQMVGATPPTQPFGAPATPVQ